jgi:hypothetical protein
MRGYGLVAAALFTASVCGFSRPPSRSLEVPRPIVLSVREARIESGGAVRDGLAPEVETRSTLIHHGRVQTPENRGRTAFTVFTDSLIFRSEAPFVFTARLSRDTIEVASVAKRPAAQMGTIEGDETMLACIFEGPSLRVTPPDGDAPAFATAEDLKSGCESGLYRRLMLAVTLGRFVFSSPPPAEEPTVTRWRVMGACPSLSGLGILPQVRWTFTIVGDRPNAADRAVEIACDTTLTNLRATMQGGDRVEVIADRIRIRGRVRPIPGSALLHEGEISLHEDIRYVRPALGSDVLGKRVEMEIVLRSR